MYQAHLTKVCRCSIGITAMLFVFALAGLLIQPATACADSSYVLNATFADGGSASGLIYVNTADPDPMTAVDGFNVTVTDPAFSGSPFNLTPANTPTSYSFANMLFMKFDITQVNTGGFSLDINAYIPISLVESMPPYPTTPLDLVALAASGGFKDWVYDYNSDGALVGSTYLVSPSTVSPPGTVPEPSTMLLIVFGVLGLAGLRRKFNS